MDDSRSISMMKATKKDATPPRPYALPTACEYTHHAHRPVGCVSDSEDRARRAARDQAAARARAFSGMLHVESTWLLGHSVNVAC